MYISSSWQHGSELATQSIEQLATQSSEQRGSSSNIHKLSCSYPHCDGPAHHPSPPKVP